MKITVWSTPNCVQCMMTKKELDRRRMAIKDHAIAHDQVKANILVWQNIERERIIKLLEAELTCDECEMNGFENDIPNKAVALIKGEK